MGLVRGLAAINKSLEGSGGGNGDRVKAKFLKLNDGEQVKVRFLQELDPDSPHYNEQAGGGFVAVEHQHPNDFKKRFVCTMDEEGRCFGCERYAAGEKGFKQKQKLYINALVTKADGSSEVVVVSQGNGPKSVTPQLLEAAGEYGSITNRLFKLKRKGSGQTDTSYTLTPLDKDDFEYDASQHELFDLEKVVYMVPFESQEKYLGGGFGQAESTGDDEVW